MYYPNSSDWWLDPSAGRFDIRANGGSPLATLNALGNLGIGTTSPTSRLQVNGGNLEVQGTSIGGPGSLNRRILLGNTGQIDIIHAPGTNQVGDALILRAVPDSSSTGSRISFRVSSVFDAGLVSVAAIEGSQDGATGTFDPSGKLVFSTSGGERARINKVGNVGIGTASPGLKLAVDGGTAIDLAGVSGFGLFGNGAGTGNHLAISNAAIQSKANATTAAALAINPLGGNVGIGTTGPAQILHVGSHARIDGSLVVGSNAVSAAKAVIASDSASLGILRLENTNATGSRVWLIGPGTGAGTSPNFNIWDNGAVAVRISIDTSGNVGIGTTNPTAKLHLGGALGDGIRFPDGTLQTTAASGGSTSYPSTYSMYTTETTPYTQTTAQTCMAGSSMTLVNVPAGADILLSLNFLMYNDATATHDFIWLMDGAVAAGQTPSAGSCFGFHYADGVQQMKCYFVIADVAAGTRNFCMAPVASAGYIRYYTGLGGVAYYTAKAVP